jgi:integrase
MSDGSTDLGAILREHLRATLDAALRSDAERFGGYSRGLWPLGLLEDGLAVARGALARRDPNNWAHVVDEIMRRHGLPETVRDRLGVGVLECEVRCYEEAIRRARGEVPLVVLPDAGEAAAGGPDGRASNVPTPGPEAAPPLAPLCSTLLLPHFAQRERISDTTGQVLNQERGTLRRFLEVAGDRPVDKYGRGDVTGFLQVMRRLPNTYGRSPKDKARSVAEIIAEADARDAERLTDKTVKRHLSALSQFFRYVMDQGHIANAQRAELVEDHRFREERGARDQRDAWTPEDLSTLFASPIWTGCHSKARRASRGDQIIRDARFWLPILALYHGARLEELADLYRRDVWCDDGVWAIRIVETDDNPSSGDRRLKTENATRTIPLHPELVRLGFLAHVEQTAPHPDDPLFPDLAPQGPDRKRGPRVTRWFVHYRRQIGVYREGIGMHAFRHTAITRLTDALTTFQQKRHRDFMMGHGGGGTEGDARYDKGADLKAVAETLALLRFPEIDLSHCYLPRPDDPARSISLPAAATYAPQSLQDDATGAICNLRTPTSATP